MKGHLQRTLGAVALNAIGAIGICVIGVYLGVNAIVGAFR